MKSVPITALRFGQCRFPVTSHDTTHHLFCAAPVERPGSPYCEAHAAVCFDRRSAEKRRADQERCAAMRMLRQAIHGSSRPSAVRVAKADGSIRLSSPEVQA